MLLKYYQKIKVFAGTHQKSLFICGILLFLLLPIYDKYLWIENDPFDFGHIVALEKYDNIKQFLETGEPIVAPHIYFEVKDDKTTVHFQDGRHRFAVLRDLGMKEIPVAINKNDISIAEKMGLF